LSHTPLSHLQERKEAAERRAAQEAARRAQEERERELIQRSERQHLNKLKLAFHKEVKVGRLQVAMVPSLIPKWPHMRANVIRYSCLTTQQTPAACIAGACQL
jgi:hypothetical protein